MGGPGRHSKIGPGAQKSTFGGDPPLFGASFFEPRFRVASGSDFGLVSGGPDPRKSSFSLSKTYFFTKSRFSVPDAFWSPNASILGGPGPSKNSLGPQNAILEPPGERPKIDPAPQKSLFGPQRSLFEKQNSVQRHFRAPEALWGGSGRLREGSRAPFSDVFSMEFRCLGPAFHTDRILKNASILCFRQKKN